MVEEEGAASFDGYGGDARLACGFEGVAADDGDIESHVLVGFCDFDKGGFAICEVAPAPDAGVCALEGFDSEDGAVANDYGLADVEAADFFCDVEPEGDVIECSFFYFGACNEAGCGEVALHEGGGGKELDSNIFELGGDCAEEGFGVTDFDFCKEEEGMEVGVEVEEVLWGNLASHDGVAGA